MFNIHSINTFIDKFIHQGGYILMFEGLKNTLLIAILGLCIGFILGAIIAVINISPEKNFIIKALHWICNAYITILRGTPILVQLLLCHFAIFPALGIRVDEIIEAIIVYGLNSSAYMAEALRGGINSVDKGQLEAGRALGFSFFQTMVKIILPQAVRNVLPTLGNEFIALIKETSVANLIAVTDLTRSFMAIAESNYEYFIPYIVLALVYLVLVMIITAGIKFAERRLSTNAKWVNKNI